MKEAGANISHCTKYRHHLTRRVNSLNDRVLTFIMLNPSKADAEVNDPTIRRCIGFCERLGYGILLVVNLFDYRATNPDELKTVPNPCSEKNMDFIREAAVLSDKVICAWGGDGSYLNQDERVLRMLANEKIALYALDVTKKGNPKHPLYLRGNLEPVIYRSSESLI